MRSILEKKFVFSVIIALLFVVCLVFMEQEITDVRDVFQKGTLISLIFYALGSVIAVEFFRRLLTRKNLEKGFVYGLAVFLGLPSGFLLALCLQMMSLRFFK